ncbi:hypothetical protein AVEN_87251-1 [Araneus ventricosus]|uniref:Uncharacterized protein n=1 Tax=Araneus ventricosus TaxID=182803 RepID=A0A4Y2RIW0_ARAVE|nr:hypothetical protein AVEN_109193-1 [Araneus ventricosus]GBN75737.1 hypothetical protein AVEN_87251-1 [Araneus ventricosus]
MGIPKTASVCDHSANIAGSSVTHYGCLCQRDTRHATYTMCNVKFKHGSRCALKLTERSLNIENKENPQAFYIRQHHSENDVREMSTLRHRNTQRFHFPYGTTDYLQQPRNFEPSSDDEDETRAGNPSPKFLTTAAGGRLAHDTDLMCSRPKYTTNF